MLFRKIFLFFTQQICQTADKHGIIQPSAVVSAYLASPAILADAFASGVLAEPANQPLLDDLETSLVTDGPDQTGLREMVVYYRQVLANGDQRLKKTAEGDASRTIRKQEEQLKEILAGIRTGGKRKRNVRGDREAGSYTLSRMIGYGGFANVFESRDEQTGRRIAVKKLRRKEPIDWNHLVEGFRREIRILQRLIHPNIVEIIDWDTEADQPFFVMEYVDGGALKKDLFETLSLTWPEARTAALQLASALAVVHTEGVIHRDLKPENILVSGDNIKLTDFGVAIDLHEGEQPPIAVRVYGTAEYASPEQIRGFPVDFRSDIYSVGVLLYEMLAGRPPFVREAKRDIGIKHIWDPPPLLREVAPGIRLPPNAEALIYKALEKNPDRRFQTMVQLFAALQACGGDE